MRITRRTTVSVVLAMVLSLLGIAKAQAAVEGCTPDIGKRTPVLLVHGFASDETMWTNSPTSMVKALRGISDIYVRSFDYSANATEWITPTKNRAKDSTGEKLAGRIACMAKSSKESGGSGKVILIAHSMGGLAARYAASLTVDNQKVANSIGLVVTLGSPSLGATGLTLTHNGPLGTGEELLAYFLHLDCRVGDLFAMTDMEPGPCRLFAGRTTEAARSMVPGTKELKDLPEWPKGIPVRTIAGNVVAYQRQIFHKTVNLASNTDIVVGVKSALHGAQDSTEGGGSYTAKCEWLNNSFGFPNCWHSALADNPLVQAWVKGAINTHLSSQKEGQYLTFKGLLLPVQERWRFHRYTTDNAAVTVGNCQSPRQRCPGFTLEHGLFTDEAGKAFRPGIDGPAGFEGGEESAADCPNLKPIKHVQIGGVSALSRQWPAECVPNDTGAVSRPQRAWYVPSRQITIIDDWETPGLTQALTGAQWK